MCLSSLVHATRQGMSEDKSYLTALHYLKASAYAATVSLSVSCLVSSSQSFGQLLSQSACMQIAQEGADTNHTHWTGPNRGCWTLILPSCLVHPQILCFSVWSEAFIPGACSRSFCRALAVLILFLPAQRSRYLYWWWFNNHLQTCPILQEYARLLESPLCSWDCAGTLQ